MFAVFAALAGALVGGLITEVRNWLQTRRENSRTLNRVLYTQLDVWHAVYAADPAQVLAVLPRIIAKQFGVAEQELRPLFQTERQLMVFVGRLLPLSISGNLEQKYQAAVDSLADVDPLLAYQLSGRPELGRYADLWRTRMDAWLEAIQASESDRELLTSLQPAVEQQGRITLLKRLEQDIFDVAASLGRKTRRRVKTIIGKAKQAPSEADELELGKMFEEVVRSAIAQFGQVPFQHKPPGA